MSQVFDVLLDNPFAIFEDRQEDHVPTATLQMYQGIADSLGREGDTIKVSMKYALNLTGEDVIYLSR